MSVNQPERNKVVLDRNGKVHNLLSVGEAQYLRGSLKLAGVKVTDEKFPILFFDIPEVVSTFVIGTNTYKLYAL